MVALRGPDLRALPHWELSSDCCEILTATAFCPNTRPSVWPPCRSSCSSQLVWSGVFSQTELLTFILFWTVSLDLINLMVFIVASARMLMQRNAFAAAATDDAAGCSLCSPTNAPGDLLGDWLRGALHLLSCSPTRLVAARR